MAVKIDNRNINNKPGTGRAATSVVAGGDAFKASYKNARVRFLTAR